MHIAERRRDCLASRAHANALDIKNRTSLRLASDTDESVLLGSFSRAVKILAPKGRASNLSFESVDDLFEDVVHLLQPF